MSHVLLKTLTIERTGEAMWRVSGAYHCGANSELRSNGTMPIRWAVKATCAPKIDGRGFLFDQARLADWVTDQAQVITELSCERLVTQLLGDLEEWIRNDDPSVDLLELSVSLSAAPFAATITANAVKRGWHL